MKKDIMITENDALAKGLFIIATPFAIINLIPILWVRIILTICTILMIAFLAVKGYKSSVKTVQADQCVNKVIFDDIPTDCKIRRSTENIVETIDDLDFPNSSK